MSNNPLAVGGNGLPAYLQQYVKKDGANYREQFGHLEPADFGLNFLKICYSNSRSLSGTWGPQQSEHRPPPGTMYLSRNGHFIQPGTAFVPLLRSVLYIHWTGKPGDGAMDFMTRDSEDGRIRNIKGLEWATNAAGGRVPPKITTYVSFYVMLAGLDQPVILSFKRTGIPEGRKLTQETMEGTRFGVLPLFSLQFVFEIPRIVKDTKYEWYCFNIKPAGFTDEKVIDKAAKMSEFAKTIDEAASGLEFEEGGTGGSEDAGGFTPPSGAVVEPPGQPTTVIIPPAQQVSQEAALAATISGIPPAQTPPAVQTAPAAQPVGASAPVRNLWGV